MAENHVTEVRGENTPARALVRPRVLCPDGVESLPLEDAIGPILVEHERGAVRVSGAVGSGKTTSLEFLAGLVPPYLQVTILDGPDLRELAEAMALGRVVFVSDQPPPKLLATLELAPWGKDEWIEYLLAADRARCGSVLTRLARDGNDLDLLEGLPELWRVVLDRMAADEAITGPRQALRAELDRGLRDPEARRHLERECLAALVLSGQNPFLRAKRVRPHCPDEGLFRLARHRVVQLLLAADGLADDLARGIDCGALVIPFPRDLVREAALTIAGRPDAVDRLRLLLLGPEPFLSPMAASLLHALRIGWKPDRPPPCLRGAYLEEAAWRAVELNGVDLRGADLSRADLWGARLDRAQLNGARLVAADLRTASLHAARLDGADLSRACLAKARAEDAGFDTARLGGADLQGANLDRAVLRGADLSRARLGGASLVGAHLSRARIDGADFSRADLSGAVLRGLNLAVAKFEAACFKGTHLAQCHLEAMALPRAVFADADLSHALLTGSRMPGANFRGARLRQAGLAEVEWEGADLRGADLRGAAFHLGSSRSGLVGSPTPCEGSRTGYYTDEFDDQVYKSPEEIRKANLTGADLRGANLDGVDFYLVDLRGARLDPQHLSHLRRCGAILESRV